MRPGDVEVVITPDLVADLYDPTLVISHGYVGPERRVDRPSPARRGVLVGLRRVITVVLLTTAVVVPLTMVVARSVPPAAPAAPAATPSPVTPASATGPGRATHAHAATRQHVVRARRAPGSALTGLGAAGAARADGTASGAPTVSTPSVTAAVLEAQRLATRTAAAQLRSADQAQAAGARAAAQAAAAQRRADRAAARAKAQASRPARLDAGPAGGAGI